MAVGGIDAPGYRRRVYTVQCTMVGVGRSYDKVDHPCNSQCCRLDSSLTVTLRLVLSCSQSSAPSPTRPGASRYPADRRRQGTDLVSSTDVPTVPRRSPAVVACER